MIDNLKLVIKIIENKFVFSFLFLVVGILAMSLTGIDVDGNKISFHSNKEILLTMRIGATFAFFMSFIILIIAIREYTSVKRSTNRAVRRFKNKKFDSKDVMIDAYVHGTSLDYLAYYKNGLQIERYNPNLNQVLRKHKVNNTVKEQLANYRLVGEDLFITIDNLNNKIKDLKQKVLIRVILDVKKGGIFYYHIDDETSSYLIGATINQDNMDDYSADHIMRDVSDKIKTLT